MSIPVSPFVALVPFATGAQRAMRLRISLDGFGSSLPSGDSTCLWGGTVGAGAISSAEGLTRVAEARRFVPHCNAIAYIGDLPQRSLAGGLRTVTVARYFECSACRAAWRASIRRVLSCGAPVSSCAPLCARRETARARACIVKTSSNNLNTE